MTRLILIAAVIGLGVVVLLVLWLGLLPPEPRQQRIERPVPIDRGASPPAPPAAATPTAPAPTTPAPTTPAPTTPAPAIPAPATPAAPARR